MGLPQMRAWLRKEMPKCFSVITARNPVSVDHMFVDINSILHMRAHRATSTGDLMIKVLQRLKAVIERGQLRASRQIFLSVDGPAPMAKMLLQRTRREKLGSDRKRKKDRSFDTRQITPGCSFMDSVERHLEYFACKHLVTVAQRAPGLVVVISGPSASGEGELKIIETIRNMQLNNNSGETERYAIIGTDTDIFLQAITANVRCLVINDSTNEVFSIRKFYEQIALMVPGKQVDRVSLDFAALILFTGNDYLPKLYMSSVQLVWDAYLRYAKLSNFRYLVNEDANSFDNVALLGVLESIKGVSSKRRGTPSNSHAATDTAESTVEATSDSDGNMTGIETDVSSLVEVVTLNPTDKDHTNKKLAIFHPTVRLPQPPSNHDISTLSMPKEYLEGILWCIEMYRHGRCSNFSYVYPFNVAPTIGDIITYLKDNLDKPIVVPRSKEGALPAAVCAAMIIQPDCKFFMEERTRPLVDVFQSLPTLHKADVVMRDAYIQMKKHYHSKGVPFDERKSTPYALMLPRSSKPIATPTPESVKSSKKLHMYELYTPKVTLSSGNTAKFDTPFWKVTLNEGEGGMISGSFRRALADKKLPRDAAPRENPSRTPGQIYNARMSGVSGSNPFTTTYPAFPTAAHGFDVNEISADAASIISRRTSADTQPTKHSTKTSTHLNGSGSKQKFPPFLGQHHIKSNRNDLPTNQLQKPREQKQPRQRTNQPKTRDQPQTPKDIHSGKSLQPPHRRTTPVLVNTETSTGGAARRITKEA
ncbi:hypothetical protein BSLG_001846 [Batrachochytrium salamandrivorans]|nr:hypothetical protein BSLG_001846 [Batrachochytrium salamandrivorans]